MEEMGTPRCDLEFPDPVKDTGLYQRVVRLGPNECLWVESTAHPSVAYSLYMCPDGKTIVIAERYSVVESQEPAQPVRNGCLLLASDPLELASLTSELGNSVAVVPSQKLVPSGALNFQSVANTGGWNFEALTDLPDLERGWLVQAARCADFRFWSTCVPLLKAEPSEADIVASDWDPSIECVQHAQAWLELQKPRQEVLEAWHAAVQNAKSKYFAALERLWEHGVRYKALLPL
ncbi:protein ORF120 [Cyprinid herpesvirus 1]|uniref:Protein ORF120 n=1 Tax=Cyprinid herpesvirus 1 TaxID=317858 RepID=K7PBE0_9VIRU|nr:protein ORF120 [Cyprinid herpesvirus 1]AFJ20414.1 protein ORF120 [Cyprinid herpesvirus 1]